MNRLFWIVVILLSLATITFAQQDVEERLRRLENENHRIAAALERTQALNAHLESEVKILRDETVTLHEQRLGSSDSPLATELNALLSENEDAGWTTATKSGLPIRFYGFVRLDTYYNSARANDPIIPFVVLPEDDSQSFGKNDDQFAFDSRLTRIGIDINAGKIGAAETTAKIEMDFDNLLGRQESREAPRIRLAFINIDFGEVSLRFGQDWDIIAPLLPAVHTQFLLWGAGNLGDRRPMAQLIWKHGNNEGVVFKVEIAAGFQGAVDGSDNDGLGGRTNLDGINSGLPHGQIRLGVAFDSWVEHKRVGLGLYGYLAQIDTDTSFNGKDQFNPWMVGVDIDLPLFGPVTLRAEAWVGQALSGIRGSILQDINTATGDEIRGWGGWAELHVQVTKSLRLAFGASLDDPKNGDLNPLVEGENRQRNFTIYGSSKLDLGGGLWTGFDVIYWRTDWATLGKGDMIRVNWWIQMNF